MPQLTGDQIAALAAFQLSESDGDRFLRGEEVVLAFATGKETGIAIVQRRGDRIRCGIVSIKDRSEGFQALVRFRNNSRRLAVAFEASDFELFGAAVINDRFEQLLLRQKFSRATVECPAALGGGEMEILSRVYPLEEAR